MAKLKLNSVLEKLLQVVGDPALSQGGDHKAFILFLLLFLLSVSVSVVLALLCFFLFLLLSLFRLLSVIIILVSDRPPLSSFVCLRFYVLSASTCASVSAFLFPLVFTRPLFIFHWF